MTSVSMDEQITVEIETLRNSFKNVNQAFKKHYKNISRRSKIPQYLIIGPHNSGKTSLLASASLSGVQHYHWWLTKQAIFLDTDGKFLSCREEHTHIIQPLWKQLLISLKHHQRYCFFKGIIVVIDLLSEELKHKQSFLQLFSHRLQQASQIIPNCLVYLIISKCDQILGFTEFFNDLTAEERQQPWGISGNVNHEFNLFLQKLNQRVIWRLHHEHNQEKRIRIKDFPLQMESLKTIINELAQEIASILNIQFGGIYFTSSLQQGKPSDYLISSVSKTFGLHQQLTPIQTLHNYPYFISDLFKKLIFENKDISYMSHKKGVLYYTAYTLAAIVISLSGFLWYQSYKHNMILISSAENILNTYNSTQQNQNDVNRLLSKLTVLNKTIAILNSSKTPWFKRLGLNQSNQLESKTEVFYQQLLVKSFMPALQNQVALRIRNTKPDYPQDLYSNLKLYLMLSNDKRRDNQFVFNRFKYYWRTDNITPDEQEQLKTHLQVLLRDKRLLLSDNQLIIAYARDILNKLPLPTLTYLILQSQYENNIINSTDSNSPIFIDDKYSISYLYTANYFKPIYEKEIPLLCQQMIKDDWILGKSHRHLSQKSIDNLTKSVQNLYVTNYVTSWSNALSHVNIQHFKSPQEAANIINALSQSDSFLWAILENARINLEALRPSKEAITLLENNSSLKEINQPINWKQIETSLATLSTYLSHIKNNKIALVMAANRMENGGQNDAITNVLQQAQNTPQPLQSWLITIANNSWRTLLESAQDYLNTIWVTAVLPQYNIALNQRYPLFKKANVDISLKDFTNFFSPNGIIDNFFTIYLKPFVNTNQFYWEWKKVDGQSLPIPQDTLEMFIRASLIKNMYFSHQNETPHVGFSLTAVSLAPNIQRFSLNIDGQKIAFYSGANQANHITWPGPLPNFTQMRFIDDQGREATLAENGPWAWFKLLDKSNLQTTANSKRFNVIFDVNGDAARYQLVADDIANPFIPDIVSSFRCPDKL